MSKKSPSDDNFEQSKSPSDRGSSQLSGQPARKRYDIRKILNLIFGVGLLVLATCGVFLYLQTSGVLSSTSEPRVEVGTHSQELDDVLQADPRFAASYATTEGRTDANGNMVEWVAIIMPDSNCPVPTAEACASVINDAVRVILTAPSIDSFAGIYVNLQSRLPRGPGPFEVVPRSHPGEPPLAEHTLDEWRALLDLPVSEPQVTPP